MVMMPPKVKTNDDFQVLLSNPSLDRTILSCQRKRSHLEIDSIHSISSVTGRNDFFLYRHPLNFAVNVDIGDPANIKTAKILT